MTDMSTERSAGETFITDVLDKISILSPAAATSLNLNQLRDLSLTFY
jgi:hypothetical protein